MEKIIKIEKSVFKPTKESWYFYEGYSVLTDQRVISVGIDNEQSCCENWGYFMSEEDPKEFEGSRLVSVKVVDSAKRVEQVPDVYEGDIMFVNFDTDIGLLQFVAYNSHNGYYSHQGIVMMGDIIQTYSL